MAEYNGARLVAAGQGSPRLVVWCFHVGAHMDASLRAVLPDCAILNYTFNPPPGSAATGKYKARSGGGGLPSSWDELQQTAAHLVDGAELGPVILAGWSEGCQGPRTYLALGARPAGVVACDGIHAPSAAPGPSLEPWRAYADQARSGGAHLAVTATHIQTQGYLSTTQTLPVVTGFASGDWHQGQGYEWAQAGQLYAEHWPGQDAAAHVAQQREVLPRLLSTQRQLLRGGSSMPPSSMPSSSMPPSSTPPSSAPRGGGAAFGLFVLLGALALARR